MTTLTPQEISQIPSKELPLSPQLSHILQEFTNLSLSLFSILASSNPSSTTVIINSLAVLDQKLAELLSIAASHQSRQIEIESLENSIALTSSAWLRGTTSLHSSIASLKPILVSGALDTSAIELSKKASLTPDVLLSYARLLAPFTSAPPSSLFSPSKEGGIGGIDPSGRSLPIGAHPPFPTEGLMRAGRLQFGKEDLEGLGMIVGEMGEVGGTFFLSSLLDFLRFVLVFVFVLVLIF